MGALPHGAAIESMHTFHKSTSYHKDWLFWLLCLAVALLFYFAASVVGRSQTNEPTTPVATELTPAAVEQMFTAWNAVALLIGGVIWHMILKVAPWAKANGGLLRGVIRFFWDSEPLSQPPIQIGDAVKIRDEYVVGRKS